MFCRATNRTAIELEMLNGVRVGWEFFLINGSLAIWLNPKYGQALSRTYSKELLYPMEP
jgi:hypothetical protein